MPIGHTPSESPRSSLSSSLASSPLRRRSSPARELKIVRRPSKSGGQRRSRFHARAIVPPITAKSAALHGKQQCRARYWAGDVGGESRRFHPRALHRRAGPRSDSASLMRAAGISEFGGAVGRIDLPDPRPLADDEVLIEIRAAGVGNWEEFVRTGEWDVGRAPPMALGVEAAGTITAIGDSVEDWDPGDEVLSHPLPLRDQGTCAPLLIASATVLARKPGALSWEAAAAFPVPALTATQVIDGALAVRPDDLVLVNGGSGVTRTLLVGLAAARGAEVIATAG